MEQLETDLPKTNKARADALRDNAELDRRRELLLDQSELARAYERVDKLLERLQDLTDAVRRRAEHPRGEAAARG
jgi:hypothetical protein